MVIGISTATGLTPGPESGILSNFLKPRMNSISMTADGLKEVNRNAT
jgi:hypothetical protein